VETNMLQLDLRPFSKQAPEVSEALLAEGVLTLGFPGDTMRLVTHRDVSSVDVQTALAALRKVLAA
jgi:threonine aldolase